MTIRAIVVAVLAASIASPALAGSAEKGKAAYVRHGCWQCHGYEGQGGVAGAKLAPGPMAFEAMNAFVRNTRGAMPPYGRAVLPDDELADIHAFLASIPKGREPATIRELDIVSSPTR